MRWLFCAFIAVHGLIHFMGFAKAFELADLPQLAQPISRGMGILWLVAGLALLATAGLLIWLPRVWSAVGLVAVLLSQIVILSAWSDAKFGTIANVILLVAVVYGFAAQGPLSLRAEYRRTVRGRLAQPVSPPIVTEADLAPLPEPVQRYLHLTGSVGQPRVHHVKTIWRGRIPVRHRKTRGWRLQRNRVISSTSQPASTSWTPDGVSCRWTCSILSAGSRPPCG